MTDVPPDNGAPGAQPAQPWDPSGIRRSNFTPPPPDAEPPTFDDDALADAMAAEVSPYTSEIKLPHLLPPEGAEFGGPAPEDETVVERVIEPVAAPEPVEEPVVAPAPVVEAAPIPLVEPARFLDSGFPADTAPLSAATGAVPATSATSPEEEELRRALGGASTLEAMQRLEDEFRRVSNGEPPSIVVPAATGETATLPAEPAPVADSVRRVNTDVFSWLSATTTAAEPVDAPVEPVADVPVAEEPAEAPVAQEPLAEEPHFDASVFDIPGAAPTPAPTPAPEPEPGPAPEPAVDPLDALAFGGAWALPDAVEEPPAEEAETETTPVLLTPLPGTDALGWNTPHPSAEPVVEGVVSVEASPRELAEPEATQPEAAEPEPEPEPEPAEPEAADEFAAPAPLEEPLGTEVWSLFPDEDVADPPPSPEESVFELPAPDAEIPESPASEAADILPPVEPEPDSDPRPEPAAFAWMFPASTAEVAPIDEPSFPLPDPGAEDPDGAPVAFESLATAAVPIIAPLSPSPVAAIEPELEPEPQSDPEPQPEPELELEPQPAPEPELAPEFTAFPGLPPVDESLIDPDAAAAAAAATLAATIPPPLPTSAPAVEPWMDAEAAEDGVWDLGAVPAAVVAPVVADDSTPEPAPETEADPEPEPRAEVEPEPAPEAPAPSPNPAIAAAAAAAALVAAAPPMAPLPPAGAPVPPSTTGPLPIDAGANMMTDEAAPAPSLDSVPAPPPTVLPSDAGPQFGVAVPYSIDPPVGPESPDWLDAPPPVYTPPELVEPPQFVDAVPNPALDPVSPITANTMARLPVPPPSELPNIADRAELPPPPGYEDIPIMSSDAAAQSAAFAPILFAPAMSAPLTPAAEPLLPVPPSAPPFVETPVPDPSAEVPEHDADVAAPSVPEATESASLDDEDDDAIDEVDRVGASALVPVAAGAAGAVAVATVVAEPAAPLSEPIATVRLDDGEPAIVDEKPKVSALEVESAGIEPTALDLRTGRAARLFWLWFAANSSVVSLGLGAVVLGTGMSLRQSIVATLAGVAISFLPLGLGTLAGKWSGQPTMVVSRAAFGHAGNILPAALAVITRVFWGGVLLWLLATAVAQVLVGAGLDAGLGTQIWQLIGLVVGFVIATVVAVFGYGFVARLQLVLSIVNGLLIVGAAVLTFQHLDFAKALTVPDGSWILAVGGAAIVFSVIGLAWVHSSSDLARYQRPGASGSGGAAMLWATFGATLPPFLLICWGAILAASDPALASGLQTNPLAAIASLLPAWYPVPLLAAAGLGLLSGAVLTIYSGGFAVLAVGLRLRRSMTTLVSAVLVLAVSAALLFLVPDFSAIARSLIITIAVPVAAWAGIFAAEMMIRTRRFHTASLLAPGGIYPQVRWLNLIGLIVISAISYGFVGSDVAGFQWQGFLFTAIGVSPTDPFGASNIGVFIALLLGILVPLAGGISAIRRQEAARPGAHAVTPATAPVVTAAPGTFSKPKPEPEPEPELVAEPVDEPAPETVAEPVAEPATPAPTRIPSE
jgi:purine-cytosine permease-like protein